MDTINWLKDIPEDQRYRALIRRMVENTREKRVPFSVSFELTPCCNLACKMCYVRLSKEEQLKRGTLLSAKQWLDLAEQAQNMGTYAIELTGGEAMLRPDFKDILRGISQMGICVDILSNGTLINDEMINFLLKYPPKNIQITLYGYSEEQYQTVCGNGSAFGRVMKNIEKLLEAHLPVSLATTMIESSNDDYLAIHRFAKEKGLRHIVGAYLHQPRENKSKDINEVRIDSLEYFKLENRLREIDDRPLLKPCGAARIENDKINIIERGFLCGGGRNSYHINWRGEMQTCPAFDVLRSYPLSCSLEKAWNDLVEQVDQVKALVECQTCEYRFECTTCASIHYGDTREFGKVSPNICLKKKIKNRSDHLII